MSRTDVHAPYRVKARDPEWRADFIEHHNHTYRRHWTREPGNWTVHYILVVACDLDQYIAGEQDTACSMTYIGRRNIHCGCRLCTGQEYRRYTRRQERTRWRSVRANLLAQVHIDEGDLDVPAIRGSGKGW